MIQCFSGMMQQPGGPPGRMNGPSPSWNNNNNNWGGGGLLQTPSSWGNNNHRGATSGATKWPRGQSPTTSSAYSSAPNSQYGGGGGRGRTVFLNGGGGATRSQSTTDSRYVLYFNLEFFPLQNKDFVSHVFKYLQYIHVIYSPSILGTNFLIVSIVRLYVTPKPTAYQPPSAVKAPSKQPAAKQPSGIRYFNRKLETLACFKELLR